MTDKVQAHWLNHQQMAISLGITVNAFSRWDVEPVARVGKYLYYEARAVLDNRLEKASQAGSNSDIEAEHLRLTRAQAEGQGIKNKLAKGKTALIEIISLSLSTVAGAASAILESLSLDIKRKFPELDTQMIEAIQRHCVKAQNEMSRLDEVVVDKLRDYLERLDA